MVDDEDQISITLRVRSMQFDKAKVSCHLMNKPNKTFAPYLRYESHQIVRYSLSVICSKPN